MDFDPGFIRGETGFGPDKEKLSKTSIFLGFLGKSAGGLIPRFAQKKGGFGRPPPHFAIKSFLKKDKSADLGNEPPGRGRPHGGGGNHLSPTYRGNPAKSVSIYCGRYRR